MTMRDLALLSVLALAACQAAPPSGPPPKVGLTRQTESVAAFGCENGVSFTAAFLVNGGVELHFADNTKLTLPGVISASGARFADARHEFWNKGDEAMYTVGKGAPTMCRVAK
jgi:membrane-bound inhibitor of C-type lysozyme